jgi:hypothetical protein
MDVEIRRFTLNFHRSRFGFAVYFLYGKNIRTDNYPLRSNDSVGVQHLKDVRVAEVYGIMALMI